MARGESLRDPAGAVRAAVVDDQDASAVGVEHGEQPLHELLHVLGLVVRRNDDPRSGALSCGRGGRSA
jgi:hypothetical protein